MAVPPASTILPGTPAYFADCLSRIRQAQADFPLDPVVFQSILLCLVAGAQRGDMSSTSKNLILRTNEQDVGMVVNLASLILTTVFGFSTHKYKAKHDVTDSHPDDFLRRLFFRDKLNSRLSASGRSRRGGSAHGPRRSSTYPTAIPADPTAPTVAAPPSTHSREGTLDSLFDVTSLASSRRAHTPASTLRLRPQAPRMQTEPTNIKTLFDTPPASAVDRRSSHGSFISLPRALVISGVEYVEIPAQRALLQVLQERRLILDDYPLPKPSNDSATESSGTWILPADFIVVYVCPLDSYERPTILSTLLDRFSMSVDIIVSSAVRQYYSAHRSSMNTPLSSSFHSLSPRMPLATLGPDVAPVSQSPRLRPSLLTQVSSSSATPPAQPIIPNDELCYLRTLTHPVPPGFLPTCQPDPEGAPDAYTFIHPSLNVYLADLFSATRHHPVIDGGLLTRRAHQDAEDLARAFRVICGDSLGTELVSTVAATPYATSASTDGSATTGAETQTDEDDGMSWARGGSGGEDEHEWLGAELRRGTRKASSVRSLEVRIQRPDGESRLTKSSESLADSFLDPLPPPPEVWDVSEVDIARVFPRVVSHRVRVRAGPDDEILGSIVCPAVGARSQPADGPPVERKTVKQVLVGILADV